MGAFLFLVVRKVVQFQAAMNLDLMNSNLRTARDRSSQACQLVRKKSKFQMFSLGTCAVLSEVFEKIGSPIRDAESRVPELG